jgi:hypothetical protein
MCLGTHGIIFLRLVGLVLEQGSPNLAIMSRLKMKAGRIGLCVNWCLLGRYQVGGEGSGTGMGLWQTIGGGSWRLGSARCCCKAHAAHEGNE